MQERYIDELVFKCLTLECDLGSAVNRLITQQGQFAVTPKSKRPGIVRKRKFDTAFLSSRNNYDCKLRERITNSWHWLQQLVPNCDPYADKAIALEIIKCKLHIFTTAGITMVPSYNRSTRIAHH
ncbi:uncharacterized protein LOC111347323 [Stylophora pistillata]|uniref:uncharacterized protein LOC111347323 n=1 Tax=Stylophora pistillata TaxID=50429 RepID=UPI000C041BB1|nr:uncharacterized protein LOC111347323 [Stylophora pistillata]